jgi:hypothetical protein
MTCLNETLRLQTSTSLIGRSLAAIIVLGVAGCSNIGTQNGTAPLPIDATALTPTVDAAVRNTPVIAGRPARVFIFAGLGDKCEQLAAPQITVTNPPAKGELSFVPGQETTIAASARGTCTGQKGKGTGVYYTAHAGQKGTDRFSVVAKLASGETATRTFEVNIAD